MAFAACPRAVPLLLALLLAASIATAQAPASAAPVRATFAQPAPVYVGDFHAGVASSAAGVVLPAGMEEESVDSTATFGRPGVVLDVDVVITGLTHAAPYDLQLLLVGPGGEQSLLMSDPPSPSGGVSGISIGFDDESEVLFNDATPLSNGTFYQTEGVSGDPQMPFPAPPVESPGNLSVFDGTDASGEWHLYVHNARGVVGEIAGWGLQFQLGTTPYPSTLSVAGVAGRITDLNVSLLDIGSTFPGDLDVLLVGPQGQRATLMSDTSGEHDVTGVDLVFDDSVTQGLPERAVLSSGRFHPTDFFVAVEDTYPGLTSGPGGLASLAVFNGTDPNGVWSLYAVDDSPNDFNEILGGWSLDIEVDDGVAPAPPAVIVPPPPVSHDTTPPTAKKLTPRRNAVGVTATAKVTVVASEQLAPASVTPRTVLLARGSTKVKATVALKRGRIVVLTPRKRLAAGSYQVTVSTKVTDLAGNSFDGKAAKGVQTLRWTFKV